MKSKKAQTGSALSWFVGSIVVAFILLLFFIFGFGRTAVQQAIQGKPEIKLGETTAFHQSEQQRQLFVLFESEFENKDSYDIAKKFVLSIPNKIQNAYPKRTINNDYLSLNVTLQKHFSDSKKRGRCFGVFILDNQLLKIGLTELASWYFIFDPKIRFDIVGDRIEAKTGTYSFFFPEKSFALIKYIPTECSEEGK